MAGSTKERESTGTPGSRKTGCAAPGSTGKLRADRDEWRYRCPSLSTIVQNQGSELPRAPPSAGRFSTQPAKQWRRPKLRRRPSDRDATATFKATASLDHASLWSPDEPNLYSAIVTVESGGHDARCRASSISACAPCTSMPKRASLLNGKSMKIQGTCNHQDHAGVGAAVPDALQWYRLAVLKEMGGNAVRTSHNMPTPEWVDACNRMGMMMMCETRQMSSSPEGLAQLSAMVKRYRNSPCVILWSIGNEEWQLQNAMAEEGAKIGATMVERCHELDPTRAVSAAVNGNNKQGVSDSFDVIGFNYNLKYPDAIPPGQPHAADLRLGDGQRDFHARRVHYRSPAQHGQRLRREPARLGRNRSGVVDLLRHAASGKRAVLPGPASIIAASPPLTAGLPSVRNSELWIPADFRRTPSSTTKRGGARTRCCICFRTGTSQDRRATRFPSGCTRISMRWSCWSTARARDARKFHTWGTWSGRCATSRD